ncbi:MAG: peptide deformylase [bacterium]|nr:peptide deformylase [bacterium]
MARLKLVKFPNNILRENNKDIKFPLSPEIRELIDQMIFACKKFKGVGLAAPQIGKNLNLAIINLEHYDIPAFAIINPRVVKASSVSAEMEEGCLSLPRKFGAVLRPEKIKVNFSTAAGKKTELEIEGLAAIVFQHEIDHLNNILICDKWDANSVHDVTETDREEIKKSRDKKFRQINQSE